jgi:hypothetical protein
MFGSFVARLRADDFRPDLTAPDGPKLSALARCTAARGIRLAAPASGAASVAAAAIAPRDGGRWLCGVAVALVARVAKRTRNRQTGKPSSVGIVRASACSGHGRVAAAADQRSQPMSAD